MAQKLTTAATYSGTSQRRRTQGIWKAHFDGKQYAWNDKEVAKLRSKTPVGVAKAMAEQWG